MPEVMNAKFPLEYRKLSQEEQNSRGILGRLVGKIADWKNPTRNGRLYSRELWEKVLKDPIFQEKIENKLCYGEIQHPLDGRTEIDPQKIAGCLAETPTIADDGFVYGVFDVLNTPCGQILKQLLDYGSNIGVSSRGEGDIINGDEVDPDTYNCICWDFVCIPAVKAARPEVVTESLQNKKSLAESLNKMIKKASAGDKVIMKEALNDLGISLKEAVNYEQLQKEAYEKFKDKYGKINNNKDLRKALKKAIDQMEDDNVKEIAKMLQVYDADWVKKNPKVNDLATKKIKRDFVDQQLTDNSTAPAEEMTDPDIAANVTAQIDQSQEQDQTQEFQPNENQEVEQPMQNQIDAQSTEHKMDNTQEKNPNINKEESLSSNSGGNSMLEMINTLQEALRSKQDVETNLLKLNEKLSVCYAKEAKQDEVINQLNEDLAKAQSLVKFKDQAKKQSSLIEEANQTIRQLNTKCRGIVEKYNSLVDDFNSNRKQLNSLTEDLNAKDELISQLRQQNRSLREDLNSSDSELQNLKESYTSKLQDSNTLVEKYKAVANKAINKYIESQALKLDITTNEIKNRLPQNYNFTDIDRICESLQKQKVSMNMLPFKTHNRLYENMNVEFNGKNKVDPLLRDNTPNVDDEIDDDLKNLAKM